MANLSHQPHACQKQTQQVQGTCYKIFNGSTLYQIRPEAEALGCAAASHQQAGSLRLPQTGTAYTIQPLLGGYIGNIASFYLLFDQHFCSTAISLLTVMWSDALCCSLIQVRYQNPKAPKKGKCARPACLFLFIRSHRQRFPSCRELQRAPGLCASISLDECNVIQAVGGLQTCCRLSEHRGYRLSCAGLLCDSCQQLTRPPTRVSHFRSRHLFGVDWSPSCSGVLKGTVRMPAAFMPEDDLIKPPLAAQVSRR